MERERQLLATSLEGRLKVRGGTGEGRWSLLAKLSVALSAAIIIGYLISWAQAVQQSGGPEGYVRKTDFVATLTGALIISDGDGQQLYDLTTQRPAQERVLRPYRTLGGSNQILPYNHLPFEALLTTVFIRLPYPIVFAFWTLLAGLGIGLALGMLDGVLPVYRPVGWAMSLAACSYFPLIRSLILGQNSPLVLLGLCGTYAMLKRGQPGWAGASLVLVALKPQIAPVILLFLVLQRQWRALAVFAAIFLGLTVAPMLALGLGWPLDYAKLLTGVASWDDPNAINPAIMHNWRGFATNLFEGWLPGLVTPAFLILSAVSIAVLLWTWLRSRGVRSGESRLAYQPNWDLPWALVALLAILVSPHLNPHDLTLLIFPAWIIGAYATSKQWSAGLSRLWIVLLWAGYALTPVLQDSSVIPSVLLMSVAVGLLVWQIAGARRASPMVA